MGSLGASLRWAEVVNVEPSGEGAYRVLVRLDPANEPEPAVAYAAFTPGIEPGDKVLVNTSAVELGLGTGGVHFVAAAWGREAEAAGPGHIMKLRYTPLQLKTLAAEEEASPWHKRLSEIPDLGGKPVAVGSLHSMVPVVAAAIKAFRPGTRIAYVMTDGAALPAALSKLISQMKSASLIEAVITAGHAFGGDFEAVTPASALAVAHAVIEADAVVVAMGPGVVGTGTALGTTALEQGPLLDAAAALGGCPIAVARLSGADPRERHRGISHHTMTALERFTHVPAYVPLPAGTLHHALLAAQAELLANAGRRVVWEDGEAAYRAAKELLDRSGIRVTTMGRSAEEDPLFFYGAAAAGKFAAERM